MKFEKKYILVSFESISVFDSGARSRKVETPVAN